MTENNAEHDVFICAPSFAQERLWFLDQLTPDSPAYIIVLAFELAGSLDIRALERSLAALVDRHESLRTIFAIQDGRPVQLVMTEPHPLRLPLIDLSGLPVAGQESCANALVQQARSRPFNLQQGPLLRAGLIRRSTAAHTLLVTIHHIVFDEWSFEVFARELADLYAAFRAGRPAVLPPLPIQYADYAAWQRDWLQGEVRAELEAYWLRQMAGVAPLLALPTDRPRPPVQSFAGARSNCSLPPLQLAALHALSRQTDTTLFMVLLAAFQILLARYTGQEDIVVGTPIANRAQAETAGLIGFLVNTLAIRANLPGNLTVRQTLDYVRETALGAFAHHELPFEQLVERLQIARDLSYPPLCQVVFSMERAEMTLELAGLEVRPVPLPTTIAKFDLLLLAQERPAGLELTLEYNTDLFDGATMQRMLGHLRVLLETIPAHPETRLADLPLLTDAERQLLVAWNATATPYPRESCVHTLVERQAAQTPEATALVFSDARLSYRALNQRANQLAHYLRSRQVVHETPVAICLARSTDFVVAALAVLKVGGLYVPLDPSYPSERLAFMLRDTRAPVLITSRALRDHLPDQCATVICLDEDAAGIDNSSTEDLQLAVRSDQLAYMMYTSGSTGMPKGIGIPHQAIVRLVCNTNYIALTPDDRIAQASNSSFDAATFEIWGALIHGARLVGVEQDTLLNPARLAEHLRATGITTLFVTTALFNQLSRGMPDIFGSLTTLLFGGEAVDPRWAAQVLEGGAPKRLLHVYGPTESTTFATWHHIRSVAPDATTIPIGGPLANTQTHVLDRYGLPVPPGIAGELYIGGDGLARGYLNQPALTAERFSPDAFSGRSGARLYRTGDLVRMQPDGAIEFLGRADHQVKLRGFRIELGEIEAVLNEHALVRDAVVVAQEQRSGDKRLVAYITQEPRTKNQEPANREPRTKNQEPEDPAGGSRFSVLGSGEAVLGSGEAVLGSGEAVLGSGEAVLGSGEAVLGSGELRAFLHEKLPEYMVPAAFVFLDALPLTSNGKIDRAALPQPSEVYADSAAFVAPRTPVEQILAAVWSDILNVPEVGVHDQFFLLGGHSLLATQLIAQIRAMFRVDVSIRDFFEQPTVAEFAQVLSARESQPGQVERIAQFLQQMQAVS